MIRDTKMRKLNQDYNEYHHKVNSANRIIIRKMMEVKKKEIITTRREENNRIYKWCAMVLIHKACKTISSKMRVKKARFDRIRSRDRAARLLQSFFLKIMYKKSLTGKQIRKRHVVPDHVFNLKKPRHLRDENLIRQLDYVRGKIHDQLVSKTATKTCKVIAD